MRTPPETQSTFADHLTVLQAAHFLGVSPSTLRSWDQSGKLAAKRHPINGYRLYERRELERLLAALKDQPPRRGRPRESRT